MSKLVECVPNFSEGRNQETIDAIAKAIRNTDGCTLLDIDPGESTNRTVFTFVGDPDSIILGALAAARTAKEKIDMRIHSGAHPRFGAMDVCPFVPVRGVTLEECAEIARTFAEKVSCELQVPIYLYGAAARQENRRDLAEIRKGEYEGLEARLREPNWAPDFGPAEFIPTWGATAVGARQFLIAYNVNILGTPNQAHRIALNLRQAGRGKDQPGRLREVKGMGWFVKEYNLAQVTVNLTDYRVTPPHVLFEEVKKDASELSIGVVGSEIVGLVPLEPILMAADYYIKKENLFVLDEDQKVRLAIERLGLSSVAPFDPKEKIIEYRVPARQDEHLAAMSVRRFIEEVANRSSTPGGGSVSAVLAALGAGLGSMVAKLTYGVRKFEHLDGQMRKTIPPLHRLTKALIPMIDADTNAFQDYIEAHRLPHDTVKEKLIREEKIQEGLKTAIRVPLKIMELGDQAWDAMCDVAQYGNIASKSDIQVGARSLEAGIWGACQNVLINLTGIRDQEFRQSTRQKARLLAERASEKCAEVLEILSKRDAKEEKA